MYISHYTICLFAVFMQSQLCCDFALLSETLSVLMLRQIQDHITVKVAARWSAYWLLCRYLSNSSCFWSFHSQVIFQYKKNLTFLPKKWGKLEYTDLTKQFISANLVFQCVNLKTYYCNKKDKTLYDKTCRHITKYDCKYDRYCF